MRKEIVYSFLALGGAIPVTVNAADVQTISSDVLASINGSEVKYTVGKLVPGSYTFAAKVTSKVYDVTVKIGGKTVVVPAGINKEASISFDLAAETDVELSLVSSDPGESGADFTVADAVVALDYNFATIKSALAGNADALAATIGGYNYDAKEDDVKAANDLKTKANGVKESYENYKKFKLYADKSTIQEEIDALAEKAAAAEAAYQNEQAYNRVNAAITAIKAKYNAAVAELEAALVDEAAYLLTDAKKDLNDNINVKITEATQASYTSYTDGKAVADEASNKALIPTESVLNTIVNDRKNQGTTNQTAYNKLHEKVTDLQALLDAVTYSDATVKAAFATESAAAQAAIDAVNTKVENAKNSAAQLTLNVDADETAAQTKINALVGKVTTANDELAANKATVVAIAAVQTKLDNAKTAVAAKKSTDETYPGSADYYGAYLSSVQGEINALSSAAAAAYKVDGTGTAQTFNGSLSTTAIEAEIANYQTNAIAAVEKYDALQTAVANYTTDLGAARAKVENLAVYENEAYDYKTKFDLINKRINDIKKAITAAQAKTGADHWTAMLAINADAAITTDIAALVSSYQADQNTYDQEGLNTTYNTLASAVTAFGTTYATDGDSKLGDDYQVFADAEAAIAADLATVKAAIDALDVAADGTDAAITELGKQLDELKARQATLEGVAKEVSNRVAPNGNSQSTLATNITNLQTSINTFKTTYKIGQDNSTLGLKGKADGAVTTELTEIETALAALQTDNNNLDPTQVTTVDVTDKAGSDWKTISGLTNGVYDVELKVDDATVTKNGLLVVDGTLTLSVDNEETAESISVTKLTFHENSQAETLAAYNATYSELAAQEKALENSAKAIKTAVDAQNTAKTAADKAVADLETYEVDNLKNLADVTDANGAYTNSKAKKSDPFNWYVFKTGLDADKTYEAKKTAIDSDITALTTAIANARAAEALPAPWTDEITVTDGGASATYKIADIKAAINTLKTEAKTESDNYWAYRNVNKNNMSKLLPDTITVDATVAGGGALAYYQGLKDQYEAEKADILTRMQASLNARTAVADRSGYESEISALINKVKAVYGNEKANLAKYNEQKAAAEKTQTLWNGTYTEIAAKDHSSKVQDYLDDLDAIQATLTAATNAVEENYKSGKSVDEVQDFAAIEKSITVVKERQKAQYNAQITADNAAAHESFNTAIKLATEAYQKAVQERATYSSSNAELEAAISDAAATLDAALYNCPTQIQTLTTAENEAYTAVESPTVFDVDDYNKQATAIQQSITNELDAFKTAVKTAIADFWTPKKGGYETKVSNAETAIADYSADAKKDAFKDVKALIDKGDAGVASITLDEVEDAIAGLEDIDGLLAADKDAAADKDLTPRLAEAEAKYAEVKDYISDAIIADDVNNEKQTQLNKLENAYNDGRTGGTYNNDLAYAKTLAKTADKRNAIKTIIDNFNTAADNAKTAVETAVDNDVNNTKAYTEMTDAIALLSANLEEAETLAAQYKYETSFATQETALGKIETDVTSAKASGTAVAYQTATFGTAKDNLEEAINQTLTTAFGTEKTGLDADIKELKNQYNTYVATNGLDVKAAAFKQDIDNLEDALSSSTITDLDKPADGIGYNDIKAATEALIKLQKDIADKQSELLTANGAAANAEVLADFNSQLNALAETASLDDFDEWVGQQAFDDSTLGEEIAALNQQIADLKAAVAAEENISFYKNQYQAQIDEIKAALTPVANAITAKDAQFKANAAAYATLSAEIDELQNKIDAAKEKVGAYEYAATTYLATYIESYNNAGVLISGAQYILNQAKADIEVDNTAKALDETSIVANRTSIENNIQNYLDRSANFELNNQRNNLNTLLANAIDDKYQEEKFSNALWARLIAEKSGINTEINELADAISYSYQTYYYDEDGNHINKARTSDDDYEPQIATVNAIKAEIDDLSTAVYNLGLLGDANEDGKVNVLDYQKVQNMILDPTLQPEEESDLFANIDINQNEVIEVGDLTAVVNYILNKDWQGYAAARGMNAAENESLTMNVSSLENGRQRLAISLSNALEYTAFQLDVVLPDGMTIVDASLTDRAGQSHKLLSRKQLDGSVRFLASSVTGESFQGSEGAVLYIDVEGAGSAEVLNILFSDLQTGTHALNLAGGNATGIDAVSTFESLKQKVYDLGGRVKDGLKKGVNIIRRADGSTQKVVK